MRQGRARHRCPATSRDRFLKIGHGFGGSTRDRDFLTAGGGRRLWDRFRQAWKSVSATPPEEGQTKLLKGTLVITKIVVASPCKRMTWGAEQGRQWPSRSGA